MPDYDLSRYDQVRVTVYGKVLNDNYTKILFENPNMDLDTVYLLDRVQKGENISRNGSRCIEKAWIDRGENSKAVCFWTNGGRSPGPKSSIYKK